MALRTPDLWLCQEALKADSLYRRIQNSSIPNQSPRKCCLSRSEGEGEKARHRLWDHEIPGFWGKTQDTGLSMLGIKDLPERQLGLRDIKGWRPPLFSSPCSRWSSSYMTIMVQKIARFPRVFLEDWVPLIVKSHYQTSSSCNEAFISLPEALAKFQLPLLNMFLNLKSYHLLTFLMKLSVSERWKRASWLVLMDCCMESWSVSLKCQITKEDSSQVQHLVDCCYQKVSASKIRCLCKAASFFQDSLKSVELLCEDLQGVPGLFPT